MFRSYGSPCSIGRLTADIDLFVLRDKADAQVLKETFDLED